MFIYPLHDEQGEVIGKVGLDNNDIPKCIVAGMKFKLEGAFYPKSKEFINFILVPIMSQESNA